jgi:hypothetical protein
MTEVDLPLMTSLMLLTQSILLCQALTVLLGVVDDIIII